MAFKITPEEKETIEYLRNFSDEGTEKINSLFLALFLYTIMQYTEGKSIKVPYFGTFHLSYEEKDGEGIPTCAVHGLFGPSAELEKNIIAIEQLKKNKLMDVNEIPIIKLFSHKIEQYTKGVVNDSTLA